MLLDLLLKVEHDSFFQYELKHRLLQPNKAAFRIEDAHKRGMSISPKKVNIHKYEVHTLYIIITNLYYRKSLIHSGIYQVNLETTLQVILLPKQLLNAKMPLVKKSVPHATIYANTYINVIPFATTMQMGTFASIYIESIPSFVIM